MFALDLYYHGSNEKKNTTFSLDNIYDMQCARTVNQVVSLKRMFCNVFNF